MTGGNATWAWGWSTDRARHPQNWRLHDAQLESGCGPGGAPRRSSACSCGPRAGTGSRSRRRCAARPRWCSALFSIWQLAGRLSLLRLSSARGNGLWIWHVERALHLPERGHGATAVPAVSARDQGLQRVLRDRALPGADRLPDLVLASATATHYPSVRNTVAILTAACLLIQLIPVAPPRMFANLGFVDTAIRYGQSVYGARRAAASPTSSPRCRRCTSAWAVLDSGVRAADQPEPVALARARAHDAHDPDRHRHRQPLVARRHRRGRCCWAWRSSSSGPAARCRVVRRRGVLSPVVVGTPAVAPAPDGRDRRRRRATRPDRARRDDARRTWH